jgi:hypothetical protein
MERETRHYPVLVEQGIGQTRFLYLVVLCPITSTALSTQNTDVNFFSNLEVSVARGFGSGRRAGAEPPA